MQNKKLLTWALAVIVVLVGASIAFSQAARTPAASVVGNDRSPSATQMSSAPTSSASANSSTRAPNSAGTTAPAKEKVPSSGPPRSSVVESTPSDSTHTSAPASVLETPELEVPASAQPSAATLPKSAKRAPALSGSVPKTGTAKGKLASGFPTKALPVPQGAHIINSSVSTQKRNAQVAVNYRTSLSVEAVLKFYESEASKRGWVATRATAPDGAKSISLGFGNDNMVATARTAPTGATTVAAFGSYEVGK